jgi:aspartyl/asparaginyl-tRNA synthetase
VPVTSTGVRIRIAKLYDATEEFMYKIIRVAGWARSVREGKDFCFVTLTDGST